ncbi:hypothetical protein JCM11491_002283 [Sporobolomyces phaffii]
MWLNAKPRVTCFYCNTHLELLAEDPKGKQRQVEGNFARGTPSRFDCSVCGCTNERHADGEIVSSRAAFYDSALNESSFSRRATPTRERVANASAPPPFCRQCLSNQSLQIHLLSSYPSYSSDESESEDEGEGSFPPLPEYKDSLDRRYPLVCVNCKARVEGIVRERDYRVKTSILGGRLRETGVDARETRQSKLETRNWLVAGAIWRVRGTLWITSHVLTIFIGVTHSVGYSVVNRIPSHLDPLALPALILAPLWTFWDPNWDVLRNERKKRGRAKYQVEHRQLYILLQGLALIVRAATSLALRFDFFSSAAQLRMLHFVLVASALIAALAPLRIPRLSVPPPILLRSVDSPSRPSTPTSPTLPYGSRPDSNDDEPLDPLEPLQNLSLSKRISILAASPSGVTRATSSRDGSANGTDLRSRFSVSSAIDGRRRGVHETARFGQPAFSDPSDDDVRRRGGGGGGAESPPLPTFPENLVASSTAMQVDPAPSPVEMDWSPTASAPPLPPPGFVDRVAAEGASRDRGVSFRPRQFVVPDLRAPTGLEAVLEKFGLASHDDDDDDDREQKMEVDAGEGAGRGGAREGVESRGGGAAGWWRRWMGG